MVILRNVRTGKTVIKNLSVRTTFPEKLTGYMMQSRPGLNTGILMLNTSRVHTAFMKFPLDLFYLDRSWKIAGITQNIPPFKFPPSFSGCRHIIEVPHGGIDPWPDIQVGDRLSIVLKIHEGESGRMGGVIQTRRHGDAVLR
jgi:uncharacterized membrane protein (UPF0127 family)